MRTKTWRLALAASISAPVYFPLFPLESAPMCPRMDDDGRNLCRPYSWIAGRLSAATSSDSSSPIVIFVPDIPFSLSQGQSAQSYTVNSSFYLEKIETMPPAAKISVSNPTCLPFTRCSIPTRTISVEIIAGKPVTLFDSVAISLDSLSADSATFTVVQTH
jgi:hypothetical protein